MAGSSFFALFDDIATILDDVSVLTKVAAKKTAGVLGDDLALNAQQVSGVKTDRELPVVWAVAKGSSINKLIIVPTALAISFVASWAITPLLMLGGAFLCFEGVEKIAHTLLHSKEELEKHNKELLQAVNDPHVDLMALEKDKIKGAIRTDFILSAEIIVITLGTVAAAKFPQQVIVLCAVAILMTIGVYGLVAGIVKLDDFGLYLTLKKNGLKQFVGRQILKAAPYLMRTLSVLGTAAMFLVGGSIVVHGIPWLSELLHHIVHVAAGTPLIGSTLEVLLPVVLEGITGILIGIAALLLVTIITKIYKQGKKN
jgi:predicted DNA repair protein MutK